MPAPPMPQGIPSQKVIELPKYLVMISVQFEDEAEALTFAKLMLQHIQDFKE